MAPEKPIQKDDAWEIDLMYQGMYSDSTGIDISISKGFKDFAVKDPYPVNIHSNQIFSADLQTVVEAFVKDIIHYPNFTEAALVSLKSILEECVRQCEKNLTQKFESPIEELFWAVSQTENEPQYIFGLLYQYPVEDYRLDFAWINNDLKLGIEVDGHDYHKTKKQRTKDARKDRHLALLGWEVVRFTGSEVFQDPVGCVMEVKELIYSRTGNSRYATN